MQCWGGFGVESFSLDSLYSDRGLRKPGNCKGLMKAQMKSFGRKAQSENSPKKFRQKAFTKDSAQLVQLKLSSAVLLMLSN
jgi:hypothetical protein